MSLLSLTGFCLAHDPVIVKENNTYYCYTTHGMALASPDLTSWAPLGKVFESYPAWTKVAVPGSSDYWAPELVRRNGMWRLYYAISTFGKNTSAIGLAESKTLNKQSPEYGWHNLGIVIASSPKENYNAIDPAVAVDDNGNDWLVFGSFWGGLQLVPLNKDGLVLQDASTSSQSNVSTIASRIPYSKLTESDSTPNAIEGGYIFFHEGFYYLFASHDFCCRGTASTYHIVVGRSKKIEGPYLDEDDVEMKEGGGTTLRDGFSFERWAGPGHNTVFQDDDGRTYLVYHAYDRENDGRPQLQIDELFWKNGWPCVQ